MTQVQWTTQDDRTEPARPVSVIVPTRNERDNVAEFLRRVGSVVERAEISEVIFVDDSDDGTAQVAKALGILQPFAVEVVHRPPGERSGGLAGAVIEGFRWARGAYICVIDGDLQHPPELIGDLHDAAVAEDADLVCASRNVAGGERGGLAGGRDLVSRWSTLAARVLFPKRLHGVSDPMSGFFLVKRDAVDIGALNPVGFKILLEVIVRGRTLRRAEVGYSFSPRHAGTSKASVREGLRYLRHLTRLRTTEATAARVLRFGTVGLLGLLVNHVALWSLVEHASLSYLLGAVLATQASTLSNFIGVDRWVYPTRTEGMVRRFVKFWSLNTATLLLRIPALALLVEWLGLGYLVANIVTLVGLFAMRFTASDRLIWSDAGGARPARTVHRYDIDGLASIESAVRLPELEWFRVSELVARPDIEIVIGRSGERMRRRIEVDVRAGRVLYQEHLGPAVSNFSVDTTGPIRVTVAPFLARSPHVVYTNIVEALLRFTLVTRGHMLLHSATFELDGCGVMLSARTDTGKTGTILRLMREQQGTFLSDDMTIIARDGTATSYPKPLTISAHTLRAVDSDALSFRESCKLAVQSRLHSKEGRGIGTRLAALNLPIMALNALTQRIVPPPKYMVTRLVPCSIVQNTSVRDLFIIERGEPTIEDIDIERALDELIDNTDDAYGFPPFHQFAPAITLGGDGYLTLREKERAILSAALRSVRVRRLRSDCFGWADEIPGLVSSGPRAEIADEILDLTDGVIDLTVGSEVGSDVSTHRVANVLDDGS